MKKKVSSLLLTAVALAFLLLLYHIWGCPIKAWTGISCPGCGMTRAWAALLHGDFYVALHFHPLFFLAPLLLFCIFAEHKWHRPLWRNGILGIAALFLVVYLLRLANSSDQVVVFSPRSSIIYSIWEVIYGAYRS